MEDSRWEHASTGGDAQMAASKEDIPLFPLLPSLSVPCNKGLRQVDF